MPTPKKTKEEKLATAIKNLKDMVKRKTQYYSNGETDTRADVKLVLDALAAATNPVHAKVSAGKEYKL